MTAPAMAHRWARRAGPLLFLIAAACGTSPDTPGPTGRVTMATPASVAGVTFVPVAGVDERLAVAEDATIDDARLWRLERYGVVVGALQVSAWEPATRDDPDALAAVDASVHAGIETTSTIAGVAVTRSADPPRPDDPRPRLTYLTWPTPAGFAVLTLRSDLDPALLVAAVVPTTAAGATRSRPLPPPPRSSP